MTIWQLTVALVVAIFLSALQVVLHQHQARKIFVEVQALERERDRLNEEWGRLQLEQSTWATDARVEEVARARLHMLEPEGSAVVLVR
ncbi:MAG: cell division protein FtsL [Gammaproteobacteria bacterium RIFCSPLOWO2_02_FULL_61_13]|nr:MAG: cell division protein FtsL [Gammaproteobacteria bacterium RIFCSPLOWO2_02_FULL_61_13]